MTSRPSVLSSLSAIEVERPAELIVRQLRRLLASGELKPGDRLPAERDLAEQFKVGRSHVREALKRLEFYGILQTLPQSGTVVARLGVPALEGLISNVLAFDRDDIAGLLETRVVLEVETARRAAERATRDDLRAIRRAQDAFRARALAGDAALDEDLTLHLAIANAARNAILASLVGLIAPDIMRHHGDRALCDSARLRQVIDEHDAVCEAIARHDPDRAGQAMDAHARMARAQYEKTAPARTTRAGRRTANPHPKEAR
jgi:GntR family transcriptional repressor for pyruvate dehydrogenase complex